MSGLLAGSGPERVEGGMRLATLPNALSLLRLVLIAPVLYLLHRSTAEGNVQAALLLVVAGLTDLMDGYLARRRGAVSPSGKVVDPLADKILIGALVLYLAAARGFPMWLVVLIVARDLALLLGAWFFYRQDRVVFAANWSGKLTTFTMGFLILAYVLEWRELYFPLTALASAALAASYLSYGMRAYGYALRRTRRAAPRS